MASKYTSAMEEKMREIKEKEAREREQREKERETHSKDNHLAPNQVEIEEDTVTYHPNPNKGELHLIELQRMTMPQLLSAARGEGIKDLGGLKKQELIFRILKERVKQESAMYGNGVVEVLPDGFGFLRSPEYNYLPSPDDIYISPSQIRRFGIRTGAIVTGPIRPPKENERYFALLQVETINSQKPEVQNAVPIFDDLTSLYPKQRLILETVPGDFDMRILDLITPLGKGQRGFIIAPLRSGKTSLLQKIANAITQNYPSIYLMILLLSERPEEVTNMQRSVKGEVISSTFDEISSRHIQVAEIVIEKAKRMVEYGKDVMILLDSMTKLVYAYHDEALHLSKTQGDELDATALQKAKHFFCAARNIEEGGSLTILATALADTGCHRDELILQEFQGTGNMEIHLERDLADHQIYPAINIKKSWTHKEELFVQADELKRLKKLRRIYMDIGDSSDSILSLHASLSAHSTNAEILQDALFKSE